jgi:hypothetical protein
MEVKCVKRVYEQPMHSCGNDSDTASVKIELVDAGAGHYVVMHAKHWAIESKADITQLCDLLLAALGECDDGLLSDLGEGVAE